jgi:hypothetical protein
VLVPFTGRGGSSPPSDTSVSPVNAGQITLSAARLGRTFGRTLGRLRFVRRPGLPGTRGSTTSRSGFRTPPCRPSPPFAGGPAVRQMAGPVVALLLPAHRTLRAAPSIQPGPRRLGPQPPRHRGPVGLNNVSPGGRREDLFGMTCQAAWRYSLIMPPWSSLRRTTSLPPTPPSDAASPQGCERAASRP